MVACQTLHGSDLRPRPRPNQQLTQTASSDADRLKRLYDIQLQLEECKKNRASGLLNEDEQDYAKQKQVELESRFKTEQSAFGAGTIGRFTTIWARKGLREVIVETLVRMPKLGTTFHISAMGKLLSYKIIKVCASMTSPADQSSLRRCIRWSPMTGKQFSAQKLYPT